MIGSLRNNQIRKEHEYMKKMLLAGSIRKAVITGLIIGLVIGITIGITIIKLNFVSYVRELLK